jgi:hypothetical protein
MTRKSREYRLNRDGEAERTLDRNTHTVCFAGEVAVCHRSNTGAAALGTADRSSSTPPMYLPTVRELSMRREMHPANRWTSTRPRS